MTATGPGTPTKRMRWPFPESCTRFTYTERDNVAYITLNWPEVHNPFNEQIARIVSGLSWICVVLAPGHTNGET